jgi:hypothetical protein
VEEFFNRIGHKETFDMMKNGDPKAAARKIDQF